MSISAKDRRSDRPELELLRRLVESESPSFDAEASERVADVIEAAFDGIGARVRRVRTDAGANLVIEAAGEAGASGGGTGETAPLLLLGHTDTVWPVGALESAVPWRHEGDVIAGPGVYDMKSGIVVMHAALSRIAGGAHRAVRIVLTCDEEVGSPTTQSLLRESAEGATAVLGFESPHPDGALKLGRRGSSRVRISVEGRAAHAALDPERGVSAIDELVDQLLRVREIVSTDDLPSPVLCNVGAIGGGGRTNVVPDRAVAELGLRFVDPVAERRVLDALRGLPALRDGAAVAVEILSRRPAWLPSTGDRALLERIRTAARAVGQSVDGAPASGAGDTNLLGSLGIPTLDGFGPRGGGAHAESEHIRVSSLFERIELLAAVLTAPAE